jgi:hypothetical protein
MIDLVYVAATIAFFALMIGYVRVCAALGRSGQTEERDP